MGSFGNNDEKLNAVIYTRVSTDKQVRDGHGLESQEKSCREYAERQGYSIVRVFKDAGVSGALRKRPAMQELLRFLEASPEDIVVLIYDIKRLARNLIGHVELRELIKLNGGIIDSPNHQFDETPEGNLVEQLCASVAEFERNANKRQVFNRMKAQLQLGRWVFSAPIGYKFHADDSLGKILIPDPNNCEIIREALNGFANGRFTLKKDVQFFLNHQRLKNRNGVYKTIHSQFVARLLERPIYAGFIEYQPWKIERTKGIHHGLITPDTFEQIQVRLKQTKRKRMDNNLGEHFPLRGDLACACCGNLVTAANSTQGNKKKKHSYYRCTTKGCEFQNKSIRRVDVHNGFVDLLRSVKPRSEVIDLISRISHQKINNRINQTNVLIADTDKQINSKDNEISKLADQFIETNNPTIRKRLEERIALLEDEAGNLIARKNKLKVGIDISSSAIIKTAENILNEPERLWQEGDLAMKRLVQNMVFDGPVRYSPSTNFGTSKFSLPFSMLSDLTVQNSNLVEAVAT